LLASTAHAEDPARAKELYDMGNKLYDEQKWAEAEAAYQSAWNHRKSYDLAGNLGDVEMQLGQYRDAAEHLSYAYDEFPTGGKPEVREALAKRIDEARQHIGVLKIKTNVIGARLYVDGKIVGQAPLEKGVFVDIGKRVIEARIDGHDDVLRTIDVTKGSQQEIDFQLVAKTGGASSSGNGLRIALLAIGGGLATVGVVAGIGLWADASGRTTEAGNLRKDLNPGACPGTTADVMEKCSSLKSTLQAHDSLFDAGMGLFATGLGLAGVTVVYFVASKKKTSLMGFEATPVVAPTFAGMTMTGRF
jgi:PEGA domain